MKNHINRFSAYWRTSAQNWETRRYDKPWSRFIYSSLLNRMQYLAFIIEQMPEGSHIIELGCGSGRLFDHVKNKKRLKYSGFDISPAAISEAQARWKDYPNATWSCGDISDAPQISGDLVVSAGLLDWLTNEQIQILIERAQAPYFVHSFSKKKNTIGVYIHVLFTYLQTVLNKRKYDPRKFTFAQIGNLFNQTENLKFIENRKLSFGCFVTYLPTSIQSDFSQFRIKQYFEIKGLRTSAIERLVKWIEISEIQKHLPSLAHQKVLEIGSGTGVYSQLLLKSGVRSLTALDPYVDTSIYIQDPRFHFKLRPFEASALTESFDVALLFGVLEFAANPEEFIGQIARRLTSKGLVFILYPRQQSLLTRAYRSYHSRGGRFVHFLASEKLTARFEQNGFALMAVQSAGPVNNLLIFEKVT